jgi:hypothetical protein
MGNRGCYETDISDFFLLLYMQFMLKDKNIEDDVPLRGREF